MKHLFVAATMAAALLLVGAATGTATADPTPSGQRMIGQSVLEPVYNDENAGQIGFIKQPENAPQPVNANPLAWAPFYLVVYPMNSAVAEAGTTFLCQHLPVDNCPTHGPRHRQPCDGTGTDRLRVGRRGSRPPYGLPRWA